MTFSTLTTVILQSALLAISDVMRAELAKYNVDVVIFNPGDAPNDTPLTAGQSRHYRDMELSLSPEQKQIYGDTFRQCQDYYNKQFPVVPALKKLDNPSYYSTMEKIMSSDRPQPYYCNSLIMTTIVFGIIKRLPRRISDLCRLNIMKCYQHKTT